MKNLQLWWVGSNIAYLLAGLWTESPAFAAMMFVLATASAYYHADGKHGNHMDVAAVYAVIFFIVGILWGIPPVFVLPGAVLSGIGLRRFTLDIPMEQKVGALFILLMIFGFLSGAALLLPMAVLVVALAVRQWVDHGLWHVLSAAGLALTYHAISTI